MRKLIWITAVVALAACKVDEPAKKAAANSSERPAAPTATTGNTPATAGSATPAAAGEEDEGSGPVPSCADAITSSLASFTPGPESAGLETRLQAAYTRRCTEDKWPAAVLRCFAAAPGMTAMKLCRGRLPREQSAKLQADLMGVMGGGTPPPGPVPVGGPPAAPAN